MPRLKMNSTPFKNSQGLLLQSWLAGACKTSIQNERCCFSLPWTSPLSLISHSLVVNSSSSACFPLGSIKLELSQCPCKPGSTNKQTIICGDFTDLFNLIIEQLFATKRWHLCDLPAHIFDTSTQYLIGNITQIN